ncbi:MAG TPA: type III polyketide synthase [Candidatus Angelobacter sp.]|nr:type III polyketide synthase [Candidatus Angelobacter sp.]
MNHSQIIGIGTANPSLKLTQEETFHLAGYKDERILSIFLNSGIDHRYFYIEGEPNRNETSDQLNARFLRGAVKTGCEAIVESLKSAETTVKDIDFLVVCTCTGYVCPDVGSRLIAHMGFSNSVRRASMVGLGCAGAVPTLQRAVDFVRANPGKKALMLAVEICSACYYVDHTLETVVGNAICADGAAAFVLTASEAANGHSNAAQPSLRYPQILDFESFINTDDIEEVGFQHRDGKLRIVLGVAVRYKAGPMIEKALLRLLERNGMSMSDVRFWVMHPGGRKVIDNVQEHFGMSDDQLVYSRNVLRNFGNMSSPTVMFVLDEVVRTGDPRPGDWGVMLALGPGIAAEAVLLRW